MAIKFKVTKKTDKSGSISVDRYTATAVSNGQVNNLELAKQLSENTSLNISDVMAVLEQLPEAVAKNLKCGHTVKIDGLGLFINSVTSNLENDELDVTPSSVHYSRTAFRADASFREEMCKTLFIREF